VAVCAKLNPILGPKWNSWTIVFPVPQLSRSLGFQAKEERVRVFHKLAVPLLMCLALGWRPLQAASIQELDKFKTACDSGDQRSCLKLESAAMHDKKADIRLAALSRITNRDILGRIANAAKLDPDTKAAAIARLGEMEHSAYQTARSTATEAAYEQFRKSYPQSKYLADLEEFAYQTARRTNTEAGYELFQKSFPQSKYLAQLEEFAWQTAQRAGTKEAFLIFQKSFPQTKREEELAWALRDDDVFSYDWYLGRVARGEFRGSHKDEATRRLRAILPPPLSPGQLDELVTQIGAAVSPHSIAEVYKLCADAAKQVDQPDQPMMLFNSVFSGSTKEQVNASRGHVQDSITIEKNGASIRLMQPVSLALAPRSPIPFRHVLIFKSESVNPAYINIDGQWYKWR